MRRGGSIGGERTSQGSQGAAFLKLLSTAVLLGGIYFFLTNGGPASRFGIHSSGVPVGRTAT